MTKKGVDKPRRERTRREETRWQHEARRHRIIMFSGIGLIIAVVLTISIGWFTSQVRPMRETVMTVNDTSYDMASFIDTLKFYSRGQDPQYLYLIAGQIPQIIERDQLAVEGAAKLGITVTDDAVKAELDRLNLGSEQFQNVKAQLVLTKLYDEYFGPQVPETADQRHLMAMFLGTKADADAVETRLANGEDFGAIAKELSLDTTTQSESGELGWHPQGILTNQLGSSVVDQFGFGNKDGTLSPPIRDDEKDKNEGYWLINVIERNDAQQQVHVQAILFGSLEDANGVKARLDGGEDFATIAKSVSQYYGAAEDGGDLGWISTGQMGQTFEDYVFAGSQIGQLSAPIKDTAVTTKGGYWVVKVLESDANRKVSDEDRDALKAKAFDEWMTEQFTDPSTTIDVSNLTQDKLIFAISKAGA